MKPYELFCTLVVLGVSAIGIPMAYLGYRTVTEKYVAIERLLNSQDDRITNLEMAGTPLKQPVAGTDHCYFGWTGQVQRSFVLCPKEGEKHE